MIDIDTVLEGKYRIESRIGSGSMAVVYRATDVDLERPVAIKVMENGDPSLLRAEARAMARLRHENVVQVYAFGMHEDRPSWRRSRPGSKRRTRPASFIST